MRDLFKDIRFGVRRLVKRPSWTVPIILVLAVGTGANTAMFSAFEAWVLRPLDFPEPDRLVALHASQPKLGRTGWPVSPKNLGDWMLQQRSFEGLSAFRRHRFNLNDDYEPVRLYGARISATLFPLLGKQPVLGRWFTDEDDRPNQPASVALISDHLWRTRFDADPDIIGRSLRLDGRPHEVVGVMEPGFKFPEWAEVWTPLGLDVNGGDRGNRYLSVVGRLRSGVSLETARLEMEEITGRLEALHPEDNRNHSAQVLSLREEYVPPVIDVALLASLGSGIFVLLIICANVASLMLAQASGRSRETAVRTALGASRWRLVRQSLLEGILLALPAGAVGLWIGILALRSMEAYIPVEPPYLFTMSLSPILGAYTLAVSLLAGLACGLAPVVHNSGLRIFEALKSGGERTGGSGAGKRVRSVLVLGELALSTALLIGALLMVKSFLEVQNVEKGYRTEGLLTAELSLSGEGVEESRQRVTLVERMVTELSRIPGVNEVGVANQLPTSQSNRVWGLEAQGRAYEPGEYVDALVHAIAGDYLDALQIPVLRGRTFTSMEKRNGGKVALVSQRLGEQLWGDTDPVNRKFRLASAADADWLTVVGVVGDVDYSQDMVTSGELPEVQLYLPYGDLATSSVAIAVHSAAKPETLVPAMREALRSSAPGVPVSEILTMDEAIFRVRWVSRFFGRQLTIYAALATAIAALGLYGLTTDSVSRRTRELAIRIALGAERRDLIGMILREATKLGGLGTGLGILLALGVTRFGSQMLIGVSARDPVVFTAVALLLLAITLLAALLPARRASGLDPNTALRTE